MVFGDKSIVYNHECVVCGKQFQTIFYRNICCSPECKKERKLQTIVEWQKKHDPEKRYKSEKRLDLGKDKREGQQGYILSEKEEKKKRSRKKVSPMDQWAEAKRNGCTLSYGLWQAQRYIEEQRKGEER